MKKILVVDNDKDILDVVEFVLTYHKFEVKTTWKWQAIVKTIKIFNPDLILLDIDLGGADGGDICQKLKKFKETQHVPVILISVHTMPDKYIKACHAQGFISKPFESTGLLKMINSNLN